jgi:hypothetical protein
MGPEAIDTTKRSFLQSLLEVILEKLRWDEDTDPDEEDEDDRAAFESLRKVREHHASCIPAFLTCILGSPLFHGFNLVYRFRFGHQRR